MEITKREILFCTIIVAIMTGLGIWLSNPIITKSTQKANSIITSVPVRDSVKFAYIKRTNVGRFIAEGNLFANNPVSIPDITGAYGRIEKITEEYTMHTRTVTTTDAEGNVQTHTETYWEWDVNKSENWESNTLHFLGQDFTLKSIGFKYPTSYHSIIYPPKKLFQDDIRYVYYTAPIEYHGIISGIADNKQFSNTKFHYKRTIKQVFEKAYNNINTAPTVFWILWTVLTIGVALLFCYFDNKWLY